MADTRTFQPAAAELAASWLIGMEHGAERARLYNGHRALRRPSTRGGFPYTDHSFADEWLISQYEARDTTS